MQIRELTAETGVPAKTIRYYESIALLPPPSRQENGYRDYAPADAERLKLIAGARRLDFSLAEIREILDLRDHNIAPCTVLLGLLQGKATEIENRIAELHQLKARLDDLFQLGKTFPTDDVQGKDCVCHLVTVSEIQ
ncbi:MAG: heavy metal-responsive transcriptional regulator [Chloroflexi bacterium]|nr:heavy metal-responsive transcriptional regulator [Chloroflexota bacterium]MQC27125.1 heavy metal-responsive transcriptional regulator [Chloroflexota bacterium]